MIWTGQSMRSVSALPNKLNGNNIHVIVILIPIHWNYSWWGLFLCKYYLWPCRVSCSVNRDYLNALMILLHLFNDPVIFACHHIGSVFCHWVIGLLSGGMLSGFCTLMWWRLMNTYSFGMRIWMWNTLMPRSTSASNTLFLTLNSQNLSCI